MKKLLYGIDLDGICFDFFHRFSLWLNQHANISMPKDEDITSYYWYECVDGLDSTTFWDEFDKFGRAGGYRDLDVIDGAREGLERIASAGHEIYYITNRPLYSFRDTEYSIKKNEFPFYSNLEFARGAKYPLVTSLGISAFIDDSPIVIAELCANTQARIYCMDYPMNRGIHDVNYTRVSSWEEFITLEKI